MTIMPILKVMKFFKDVVKMNEEELFEIAQMMKYRFYEAGQTVFKQGDDGDRFFIILKGKI